MRYIRISWQRGSVAAAALCLMGCAVGPDYHKPAVQIPQSFKEGVDWQRAQANPQGSLSSTWWLGYHDEQLSKLIDQALQANQSIIAAEAAYRLAQATVSASVAALYPTVSANVSGTRGESGSAAAAATGVAPGVYHSVTASVAASWELDLWGKTRRQIESSKANAQASDAQRAGQRLSIAAGVASYYFALRQADLDIDFLQHQQQVYGDILAMTQAGYAQGGASGDEVLIAQDTLEAVIAALQATQESTRAQREAGTASRQSLLNEQLTLLSAKQNLQDTQASLTQSSVTLIKNLGGGWQWDESRGTAAASTSEHSP